MGEPTPASDASPTDPCPPHARAGRVCGKECYQRALEELRSLDAADGGPSTAEVRALSGLHVDPCEVQEEWWSGGAEDNKSLDERLNELLYQVPTMCMCM